MNNQVEAEKVGDLELEQSTESILKIWQIMKGDFMSCEEYMRTTVDDDAIK